MAFAPSDATHSPIVIGVTSGTMTTHPKGGTAHKSASGMNAQLQAMVSTNDRNRRARLAAIVQADIDAQARVTLRLIERQRVTLEALIAAGVETLSLGDETLIVSEMLREGE